MLNHFYKRWFKNENGSRGQYGNRIWNIKETEIGTLKDTRN